MNALAAKHPGHGFGETGYRMAATSIERHEAERATDAFARGIGR